MLRWARGRRDAETRHPAQNQPKSKHRLTLTKIFLCRYLGLRGFGWTAGIELNACDRSKIAHGGECVAIWCQTAGLFEKGRLVRLVKFIWSAGWRNIS